MDNVCKPPPPPKKIRIYLACVFICLVSLFTQESILFGLDIFELEFKTSRQVGTLSILSHFLFFCCFFFCTFVFLFVCLFFFFKKNLTIISLLTLYIVNKATIGLRVGITQRRNSKWPSCDVLILTEFHNSFNQKEKRHFTATILRNKVNSLALRPRRC